jgi:C1A family cysteine protease
MTYQIQRMGWLPDPPDIRDRRSTEQPVAEKVTATVQSMAKQGEATGALRQHLQKQAADVERVKPGKGAAGALRAQPEKLASDVDLRELCSPVEDQGEIGSCTAHAVCGLVEYLQRSLKGEHIDASRLYLYKVTRGYLGWTGDTGAFVRSTIKALRLFGVPPEAFYPYDTACYDEEPGAFCYAFGGNYKAVEYYRLEGLDALRESLCKGIPFAFGFTCYRSLSTDQVRKTGDVPFPTKSDKIVGGHAVMAVGYDEKKGVLRFRNSWGTGWGDEGYGTLPYEYVEQGLATDCWALLNMDIVDIEREA